MNQSVEFLATADQPYWLALAEGRLTMQHCECGEWHWPAVWRCGRCGWYDPPWEDLPFEGTVYSWQTSYHDFGQPKDFGIPYTTVLVEIGGTGRRLLGVLEGSDGSDLRVGQSVTGHSVALEFRDTVVPGLRWRLVQ